MALAGSAYEELISVPLELISGGIVVARGCSGLWGVTVSVYR